MLNRHERRTGLGGRIALCVALGMTAAACDTDSLLEVEEPTFATPGSLRTIEGLPILYAGALGDFQIAYSGSGGDAFLTASSLFSDELHTADTFTTRQQTDQRVQQPVIDGNLSDAGYNRLQYARRAAAEVAEVIADIAPQGTSDARYAVMKALEGYAIVALGEGWCGAVPLGTAREGAPDVLGTPLSTQQLFTEAVARFDAALAGNPQSHLAAVGKGRALLNNGDFAGAAAAVSAVPTTFIHFIEHSANTSRQFNPLFALQSNRRYSVSHNEGINGLPFRTDDPRLPWWEDPLRGFDNAVALYVSDRYPNFDSNVVLADGIEARLIEAEAALQANNTALWLSKLNELRASVHALMAARYDEYVASGSLPALTDPGSAAARVDLMFRERAFWLFLTGHRHGDLRRLVRQYNRPQSQVFPTGPHHRGGDYGAEVVFPIPFNEHQNENYNPEQCVLTQA